MVVNRSKNQKARVTQKKRRQWCAREKLLIIRHAEQCKSNCLAARRFDVEPKQIRYWKDQKSQLESVAPHIQKLHKGKGATLPEFEKVLFAWVSDLRKDAKAVTRNMVIRKAKLIAKEKKWVDLYPIIIQFKFSETWLEGFMKRYNLATRRKTHIAQHLPDDLIEKQQNFLSFILYRRIQHDYPLRYIGNMNETPVAFNLPYSTTLDHCGTSTVNIRTTGHEKTNFTVILTCMADGTKLPAVCIFKLKNVPREAFPRGIYIRVNEKGWCNEQEMLWWVENVWKQRNALANPRSLLVLDSFRGHLVDSVKNRFNEKQTNIAVIPGGLTGKLQPLDVAINKSFKAKLRQYYNEWMNFEVHELTPAGRIKRPSYATVAEWVKKSWDEVDVSLIRRSFKCCGISIARDGSEDNLMFDYDDLLDTRKNRRSGHDEIRDNDSEENTSDYYNEESDGDYCNEKSDSEESVSDSNSEESVSDSNSEEEDIEVNFDINEYEEQEAPDYENEFN
jgi:hypothetical protein